MSHFLFGKAWEGSPLAKTRPFIEAPVGWPCLYCSEPIKAEDSGQVAPFLDVDSDGRLTEEPRASHRDCFLCALFGPDAELLK